MDASPYPHIHDPSPTMRAAKDITFGSVRQKLYSIGPKLNSAASQAAGIVSKVFEHPFDLTKVRLQAQVLDATARFRGPLDCLVRTFRSEGVRGLYRVRLLPFFPILCDAISLFRSIGFTRPDSGRHGRKRDPVLRI
jgi:ornithine carrier protein